MAAELSKKQLSAAKRDAHVFINAIKSNMKELMKSLKSSSGWVYKSAQLYYQCRDAFTERDTEKNQKRFTRAEESYAFASNEYARSIDKINNNLSLIEKEYEKLIDTLKAQGDIKGAEATKRELDEYVTSLKVMMAKNDRSEGTALPPNESANEAQVNASTDSEEITPVTNNTVRSSVTSVDIAPMTIDVTAIVESAINSAIERLNDGLTKRIDEYVASLQLPSFTQEPEQGATEGGEVSESGAAEQIRTSCNNAAELIAELNSLVDGFKEIAEKQKALAELQKQINDVQRQTAREQEGVKVNQKLISNEQAAVTSEQSSILLEQKRISEEQKTVVEAQNAVADSFEEVVRRERELADKQREILRENDSLSATVGKIVAKQGEVHAAQKETLLASRKLQRDQKQLLSKLVPKSDGDTDI